MHALDAFTRAYIRAALWASTDENGNPLDDTYDADDIAPDTLARMIKDCADFRAAAGQLLDGWTDEQAGHDFWLTRCGHGTGFWDRGIPYGEWLASMVGNGTKWPNVDLYVGDDGMIYAH